MCYGGRLIFKEFVNKVQIPEATAALRSPIAFKIALKVNFTQFCLQMCIFFCTFAAQRYLEGIDT